MPDWNQPLSDLPDHTDVLVVGSGPAGSAAARVLAQCKRSVVLIDAQAFPRDKTCGDGLVPDTHAALRRLGVIDEVLARARPAQAARCVAPNGRHVDVAGELAVLPRRELDALLCHAAVQAGAQHVAPARFVAPLRKDCGRVTGALLEHGGQQRTIQASWLVLASGAGTTPLSAAELCQRKSPSCMAIRGYVRHADPGMAAEVGGLRFVWHPRLRDGYGWIFEGPDHTYNLGTGVLVGQIDEDLGKAPRNLRRMFEDFLSVDPVAARLVKEGEMVGELKGAPLRCDLEGAIWAAPGVLVAGDAVGATYSFSGEGIGKAMETGIAAADALVAHRGDDTAIEAAYRASLQALKPRFEMYRQAASFNSHPWLLNVMVWRARHSPRILAKLSDILNERRMPGSLLTWRGVRSMLLP
ncbi:MAG: FAD-dependent monooxygenase [Burkholderiales bacterium]|nr:FAD-dependent monooxygenase [Burkholderiales bacterium]